jgi:alkyl hydroperoxide reductase subunit AhpC
MSALRVGDKAPDFRIKGILRGDVTDYALAAYASKWLVLFFYPADFTFICPTEVTGFSKMAKDFAAESAPIIAERRKQEVEPRLRRARRN